jgi:hypothetical protein
MTQFTPPSARTLPEDRRAAMRHQLTGVVTGSHHRRRPLFIAASAVVIAVGTSAGAYAYVQHSQPVTDKSEARCYTVASLSAGPESYATIAQATMAGSSRPAQVGNAVSVCAALWRQGFLHPGPQGARGRATPGPAGTGQVPPLVACVLPGGTAAVFPGTRATCVTLGLPNAASHRG